MSVQFKSFLNQMHSKYLKACSEHNFLTWLQIQRTGTIHFNPIIQGCTGSELDQLLFQHS